jgi:hypothetical protein
MFKAFALILYMGNLDPQLLRTEQTFDTMQACQEWVADNHGEKKMRDEAAEQGQEIAMIQVKCLDVGKMQGAPT